MEIQKQEIKQLCSQFALTSISTNIDQIVSEAEKNRTGFMQYTLDLLTNEAAYRLS
jgi:hypothetical protein